MCSPSAIAVTGSPREQVTEACLHVCVHTYTHGTCVTVSLDVLNL